MTARYAVQPDPYGYAVYDVWTGQTVVIAGLPQEGLAYQDAQELADMLNLRATRGDRDVRQ